MIWGRSWTKSTKERRSWTVQGAREVLNGPDALARVVLSGPDHAEGVVWAPQVQQRRS